jgi:uncharacterized membrane protein
VSPALPGVAVAVAVVPPLATCGLCLSAAKWDWALGAFLLFVANFLAIEIAAAVVFSLAGMVGLGAHRGLGLRQFIARFWISLVLFAGVAVLLTHTLVALVSQRRLQRSIETVLADELRSTAGAQLSGTTVKFHPPRTEVIATVVTPVALEAHQVAQMQDLLRRKVGGGTDLILRSLISKDFDAKGPVFVPPDEAARKAEATSETTFLNQATSTLTESLKGVLGAHLSEVRRERQGDRDVITAVVRTPQVIQPNQVAEAESAVQRATGASVHLVVRSILARDADDRGYLYQPAAAPEAPLPPEQRQVRDHVRGALERRLPGLAQGAYVTEVRYVEADSRLRVLAVARTPTPIGPGKVAQLQEVLRRWVDPGIDLTVRSDLGADAAASGYLANLDDRTLAPASPAAR